MRSCTTDSELFVMSEMQLKFDDTMLNKMSKLQLIELLKLIALSSVEDQVAPAAAASSEAPKAPAGASAFTFAAAPVPTAPAATASSEAPTAPPRRLEARGRREARAPKTVARPGRHLGYQIRYRI